MLLSDPLFGVGAGIRTTESAILPRLELGKPVSMAVVAPTDRAFAAIDTSPDVSPEPEPMTRRSPPRMAGVVTSPATWTWKPICMSLMAKARIMRPDLPAPAVKIVRASRIVSMNRSVCSSSRRVRVASSSLATALAFSSTVMIPPIRS